MNTHKIMRLGGVMLSLCAVQLSMASFLHGAPTPAQQLTFVNQPSTPVPAKAASSKTQPPSTIPSGGLSAKTLAAEQQMLTHMHMKAPTADAHPTTGVSSAQARQRASAMLHETQAIGATQASPGAKAAGVAPVPPVPAPANNTPALYPRNDPAFVSAQQTQANQVAQDVKQMQRHDTAYRNGVNFQINALSQADQSLQSRIQALYQQMQQNKQAPAAKALATQPRSSMPGSTFSPHQWLYLFAIVMLLLLVMGLSWVVMRMGKAQRLAVTPQGATPLDSGDEEYDFLGSAEGVGAKLDLARAYIAMEDCPAAVNTLQDVLRVGNAQHRQSAQQLLKQIAGKETGTA